MRAQLNRSDDITAARATGRAVWACLAALAVGGCGAREEPRVVLYCAQDQEFAEGVLADFTRATGLPVAAKFDTEATKSVSLATELALEQDRPRCDVHWNNEILATIRLQRQGVYGEYRSPSTEPYPAWARATDGTWTAFASRARIILVNTKLVPEADRPKGLLDLTDPRWKGKVAIAKPQFGTTATQAACLFEVLGPEKAKAFYQGLKDNGVAVVAGNKPVAEGVGRGEFAVGLTDTDDALVEIAAGRPVAMIFPDKDGIGTLFIPNTVAVVKNGPNPTGAKQLVDYLLSAEVETKLAEGPSHQIPLNPKVKAKLPPGMETPATVKAMAIDWARAADRWNESQAFVIDLFGR
jgi:iron(III) transport system substrate-binding protein